MNDREQNSHSVHDKYTFQQRNIFFSTFQPDI